MGCIFSCNVLCASTAICIPKYSSAAAEISTTTRRSLDLSVRLTLHDPCRVYEKVAPGTVHVSGLFTFWSASARRLTSSEWASLTVHTTRSPDDAWFAKKKKRNTRNKKKRSPRKKRKRRAAAAAASNQAIDQQGRSIPFRQRTKNNTWGNERPGRAGGVEARCGCLLFNNDKRQRCAGCDILFSAAAGGVNQDMYRRSPPGERVGSRHRRPGRRLERRGVGVGAIYTMHIATKSP